jgi:GNAT superfamily N-acetyltransferase
MEFTELKTPGELAAAFEIIGELVPRLDRENFLEAHRGPLLAPHKLFGLTVSGKLVSVAAAWMLMTGLGDRLLWIYALVTTQKERSRGYGRKLMAALEDFGKREGVSEIRVHTNRERAIDFYEKKAGFSSFSTLLHRKM